MSASYFHKLFLYKKWANEELLETAKMQFDTLPKDDAHFFIRILNHTLVVDRIFAAHLTGLIHEYSATNTVETPSLAALTDAIATSDAWFCEYTQSLSEVELERMVRFQFTDGDTGTMSVKEILSHLINHGSYHRGAAGRALAVHSIAPPKDGLTGFLQRLEPDRRW